MVWTDHKNLEYIRSAKRLNARQVRWALFFTRFQFTITYRPGSRNTKPDAVSHQFTVSEDVARDSPILPPTCVIGTLTWEIESAIKEAQRTEPDPGTGPPGSLFVPYQVLHWAHTAKFTCHPGVHRTISFIQRFAWWPTLTNDVCEYAATCPVCAQNKTVNQPALVCSGLYLHQAAPGHISLSTL